MKSLRLFDDKQGMRNGEINIVTFHLKKHTFNYWKVIQKSTSQTGQRKNTKMVENKMAGGHAT